MPMVEDLYNFDQYFKQTLREVSKYGVISGP